MSATFDTLAYTERLRAAGVSEAQAKAEAEALAVALREVTAGRLASKDDIVPLRDDITRLEGRISLLQSGVGANTALLVAVLVKLLTLPHA
jgi:hypothetical protein